MSDPPGGQILDGGFEDEILELLLDENLDDGDEKVVAMEADENDSEDEDEADEEEQDGLALPDASADGESGPYDVTVNNKKSCAEGVWIRDKGLVEITHMRGKFWRVMGFSTNSKMYLNPEEALLLVEQAQLNLKADSRSEKHIPSSYFYQEALSFVPQPVVLSYVKLKSLDYIVLRHRGSNGGDAKPLRSFSCEYDVYEYMKANPSWNVLETCVAFDVYSNVSAWSKKAMLTNSELAKIKRIPSRVGRKEPPTSTPSTALVVKTNNKSQKNKKGKTDGTGRDRLNEPDDHGEDPVPLTTSDGLRRKLPKAYVIVQTGDWTFSGRLMVALMKAAKGVPLIFAAVLPSGNLILEEFTDARTSLNWENKYAIDIKYSKKTTMQTVMPKEMVERMEQDRLKQEAKAAAKLAKANGEAATEPKVKEKMEENGHKKDDEEKEEEKEEEGGEEDDVSEEEEQPNVRKSKRTRAASKAVVEVVPSKRKRRKTADDDAGF